MSVGSALPGVRAAAGYRVMWLPQDVVAGLGPLDPRHFFATIDAALDAFVQETGAKWTPEPARAPAGNSG